MKYLLGLIALLSISCTDINKNPKDFDWLIGEWERMNDEEGQRTFESWVKLTSEEYVGLGFTLQGKDTIFKENIKMRKEGNEWVFEVSGVNEKPTNFAVTSTTDASFLAENELNPFPKKIEYQKEIDQLNAIVSAESTQLKFHFKKKE